MATNKTARDSMVIVSVIVAFVVTIMANLLADKKFARVDLTSEKRYSISEPFRNIIGKLDDTLTITYYISTQVPGWFETRKRDILDKLREIETASGGKIKVEPVDPTDNKELVERLNKQGAQLQVTEQKKDSMGVMLLFSSLEMTYQDKAKILINPVGAAEDLEYQLASKILELTMKNKPVIAVQAPPAPPQNPMMGRQPQGSGYEWLAQGQWDEGKKFDVKPVEITESSPIPPETKLLILIRPKDLGERQKYEIVKYLAGGGKVLLLANGFKVSHEFGWRAEKTPTGLEDYLKEIGVTYGENFLADNSNLRMPVSIDIMTGKMKYSRNPFFIRILGENVSQESVLTRLMPGLLMPSPGEIKLVPDQIKKNNLKETVLAKTSKQTWTIPFSESVNPEREMKYDEAKQSYEGTKDVFVQLDGQFPFPYEGKPVPPWKAEGDAKPENASVSKQPGILVVCSCPEAFHFMYLSDEQIGSQMQGNAAIIVNMAESFSLGDDLVKLRTKRYETRAIDKLSGAENDGKRTAIKLLLIMGVPALVLGFALLRAVYRHASQTRYERQYAATSGPSSFSP